MVTDINFAGKNHRKLYLIMHLILTSFNILSNDGFSCTSGNGISDRSFTTAKHCALYRKTLITCVVKYTYLCFWTLEDFAQITILICSLYCAGTHPRTANTTSLKSNYTHRKYF